MAADRKANCKIVHEKTKGEYVVTQGVFVSELRDSYTLGVCEGLPDGVSLSGQLPLLMESLTE